MISSSMRSLWPKGFFTRGSGAKNDGQSLGMGIFNGSPLDEKGRKRLREGNVPVRFCGFISESRTPTLVSCRMRLRKTDNLISNSYDDDDRPTKRQRGERVNVASPTNSIDELSSGKKLGSRKLQSQSAFLSKIPEDVVALCLSFLGSTEDRYSLQCSCKQFRNTSNSNGMLEKVRVGGDRDNGKNGIIREQDTPETAAVALSPFVHAGNLEATYMLGIIKSYCYHQDVERGICLLKYASSKGYNRSSYALGLVLRDSQPEEAAKCMKHAADKGYLPALQELLPAREMKAKYGEPNADELRRHLDPICLNLLLGRHYVHSAELRELNTSHCWNPLCGRWAFKASVNANGVPIRNRRQRGFASNQNTREQFSVVTSRDPSSNSEVATGRARTNGATISVPAEDSSPNNNQTRPQIASTAASVDVRVSRMKMCSRCCRAKYCSKLCQVYDWRSGRHKMECQFL